MRIMSTRIPRHTVHVVLIGAVISILLLAVIGYATNVSETPVSGTRETSMNVNAQNHSRFQGEGLIDRVNSLEPAASTPVVRVLAPMSGEGLVDTRHLGHFDQPVAKPSVPTYAGEGLVDSRHQESGAPTPVELGGSRFQ